MDLKKDERDKKIWGMLIWRGFLDMETRDRFKMVYDYLKADLSRADYKQVAAIFPATPQEAKFIREGADFD